jgi:OOP family OmpA-OmpF porin
MTRTVPSASGVVEGHTDSVGNDDYNLKLSQRRADSVRKYLVDKGVPAARLEAKGYGEAQPVADNKTADGRAQNRRVVLKRNDVK